MKQNGISSLKKGGFGEFYPFGMLLPGRNSSDDSYRYGFNGMEMDDEIHEVKGSSYDFGARLYNPRVGRWLSGDPAESHYPSVSTFTYAQNSPMFFTDPQGETAIAYYDKVSGKIVVTSQVILYTGDRKVYDKIDCGAMEAKYTAMTEKVMVQNDDGTYSEAPPVVTLDDGTVVEVEFRIEVVKVYDQTFNNEISDPSDFDSYVKTMSVDRPDRAADANGSIVRVNADDNSYEYNFVRVENTMQVSAHFVGGNTGCWPLPDIIDDSGNPNTTPVHELLFHGILEQSHPVGVSTNPDDHGGAIPIGIPKYYEGGVLVEESQRKVYQSDIDNMNLSGFSIENNDVENPFNVGWLSTDQNGFVNLTDGQGRYRSEYETEQQQSQETYGGSGN
jgi:RHS repeat-associated protein